MEDIGEFYDDETVTTRLTGVAGNFNSYAHALEGLYKTEADERRQLILKSLIAACNLGYCQQKGHPPFVPHFIPIGQVPTLKIPEEDYKTLSSVVDRISNAKLRARVADLLWCCVREVDVRNDIKFAILALDAYCEMEIVEGQWIVDSERDDWRRALKLAKSLGKTGSSAYSKLALKLTKAYEEASASGDVKNLLRWAIPALLEEDDLNEVISPHKIALGFLALRNEVNAATPNDYYSLQTFSRNAAEWFNIARNRSAACDLLCDLAGFYVAEAESESQVAEPVWLRVAERYNSAISVYTQLPKDYREANNLDMLCDSAKIAYEEAVKKGLGDLKSTFSQSVDVSEAVQWAKSMVSGFDKQGALERFAALVHIKKADVESTASSLLASSITAKIMGAKILSPDGRVVATAPADSCRDDDAHKERLGMEVVRYAAFSAQVEANSVLAPAYETIKAEHELTVEDFIGVVAKAELIPAFHKRIYAEGLYLGWKGHFTAATYILAPEIENCIRVELKRRGCITTSYECATQLQSEVGLSTLIKNHESEIVSAFGDDFAFLLKAILSDHRGPNVRNEVAHGLKTDVGFDGSLDMFVWWFALRMVYLRAKQKSDSEKMVD